MLTDTAPDPRYYVDLDSIVLWENNPQEGDVGAIYASIKQFGFNQAVRLWQGRECRAGNHSVQALRLLRDEDVIPQGTGCLVFQEHWYVAYVDISHLNEVEGIAYGLADNRIAALASQNEGILTDYLEMLAQTDLDMMQATGFDDDDLYDLQQRLKPPIRETQKPNSRQLPIDVIYTLQMADCTCCLAIQAGLKYGIQSSQYRICPYCGQLSGRHAVTFVDNDYFHYDHAKHIACVREFRPKYATVRDVMTRVQCDKAQIEYYDLDQILDWAEELRQYAENVIVIPKYDCFDRIPDYFMLGYSVPTSHGGTSLPPEHFSGRRVHLLGGSWKAQLAHMAVLGDDVVSIDNNHIQHIAREWGQFINPEGDTFNLTESGFGYLNNGRYAALALSFGAIGAKVNELYAGTDLLFSDRMAVYETSLIKTE